MEADLLCKADARACSVSMATSKIRQSNASLGVFAAKTFQNGGVMGSCYGVLVYQDLSCREHARMGNRDEGLKRDVERFSMYGLQVQVQERGLE